MILVIAHASPVLEITARLDFTALELLERTCIACIIMERTACYRRAVIHLSRSATIAQIERLVVDIGSHTPSDERVRRRAIKS